MPKEARYLACYDVTNDRERELAAGVLEGYGLRVQMSVFECRLTRSGRERLVAELEKLELKSGFLFLYKLDAKAGRRGVGALPEEPFAEERFSFVV